MCPTGFYRREADDLIELLISVKLEATAINCIELTRTDMLLAWDWQIYLDLIIKVFFQ